MEQLRKERGDSKVVWLVSIVSVVIYIIIIVSSILLSKYFQGSDTYINWDLVYGYRFAMSLALISILLLISKFVLGINFSEALPLKIENRKYSIPLIMVLVFGLIFILQERIISGDFSFYEIQPSLIEEIIFRGILLTWFLRICSRNKAIWVTSILFGIIHIIDSPLNAIFGVFMSAIFMATPRIMANSILPAILMHYIFNFMQEEKIPYTILLTLLSIIIFSWQKFDKQKANHDTKEV